MAQENTPPSEYRFKLGDDSLPGDNKRGKVRALILSYEREGHLAQLVQAFRRYRPDVNL